MTQAKQSPLSLESGIWSDGLDEILSQTDSNISPEMPGNQQLHCFHAPAFAKPRSSSPPLRGNFSAASSTSSQSCLDSLVTTVGVARNVVPAGYYARVKIEAPLLGSYCLQRLYRIMGILRRNIVCRKVVVSGNILVQPTRRWHS